MSGTLFDPALDSAGIAEHGGQIQKLAQDMNLDPSRLVDFSSSINPLGPPEIVRKIIAQSQQLIGPYPDTSSSALRNTLAHCWNVSPESIVVGNGSTELIFLIARAMRGGSALILGPTFGEYERAVRLADGRAMHSWMDLRRAFSWQPTEDDLRVFARGGLCFICNPNNPSGTILPRDLILDLARQFSKTVFVIDEAFIDFLPNPDELSCMPSSETYPNLIVLRSFTKFYSVAGLRLGCAVASPGWIRRLEHYKEPWAVNALAQAVGEALISEREFAVRTRRWLVTERQWLLDELSEIDGLKSMESCANYILIKITAKDMDARRLYLAMLKDRIVIRNTSNFRGLDSSYIRIAVKKREQNRLLLESLKKYMPGHSAAAKGRGDQRPHHRIPATRP